MNIKNKESNAFFIHNTADFDIENAGNSVNREKF
jgi:hypothetical protein